MAKYHCIAHHKVFDAEEPADGSMPRCPHGCTTVKQTYSTEGAPKGVSKGVDANLQRLADRFGMTDISNRNGTVAASRHKTTDTSSLWGELPKGDKLVVGKGIEHVDGSSGGAQALASSLAPPSPGESSFMDIAKEMPKPAPVVAGSYGGAAEFNSAMRSAQ